MSPAVCTRCDPNTMNCPGGSIGYPQYGYWRQSNRSDNVVKCPYQPACLGGEDNSYPEKSEIGYCYDGYRGNACGVCKEGWAKFGTGKQCTDCSNDGTYYLKLAGMLILQLLTIVINIFTNYKAGSKTQDPKEVEIGIYQSTLIKVLVDYSQIVGLISTIKVQWPGFIDNVSGGLSKVTPSGADAFSMDCFFVLGNNGDNQNLFFKKTLIIVLQPFLLIISGIIILSLGFLKYKGDIDYKREFGNKVLLISVIIIYMLQPQIINLAFELFHCTDIGPSSDPQYYLYNDLQVKCWTPTHTTWALGIGIPAILFLIIDLVLPVLMLTLVGLNPKKVTRSEKTMKSFGFIFNRYQDGAIYWDLTIILKKAMLTIFSVFVANLYGQIFFAFAIFLALFYRHMRVNPYKLSDLNKLEASSMIALCFLLFSGLFFIERTKIGPMHIILIVISLSVNIYFVLGVLKCVKHIAGAHKEKLRPIFIKLRCIKKTPEDEAREKEEARKAAEEKKKKEEEKQARELEKAKKKAKSKNGGQNSEKEPPVAIEMQNNNNSKRDIDDNKEENQENDNEIMALEIEEKDNLKDEQ